MAIVSGIGPGMGRDISLLFAEHGADLVLGARGVDKCEAVAEEVRALGRKAEPVALDITDPASCARPRWRRRCAPSAASTSSSTTPSRTATARPSSDSAKDPGLESWRATMDVNLWGTLKMTAAAVPAMKERGGGHIVMINSMSANASSRDFGAYAASKAALETASKSLGRRAGRVTASGSTASTPATSGATRSSGTSATSARRRGSPARRSTSSWPARPALKYLPHSSEIAGSVLFFASDLSKPVTGQSLGVNCGHYIP